MSNVPPRTRSLRKPAETSTRLGPISTDKNSTRLPEPRSKTDRNSPSSPSRLPIKPSTRNVSSATTRPPSSTGSIASLSSNASSLRPPAARANIGKRTTGGLQRTASTRPPSTSQSTDPVKQDRSRPPITTSRHLRYPSAGSGSAGPQAPSHARAKSSSAAVTASTTLRPPTRGSAEETAPRPAPAGSQPKRPAFSTLQQHFSPAKNLAPKPHPAAFLAPPSPSKLPSNIAISAETAKLQNELLQLHLLHRDAARVEKEWRASAKRKLGTRFQSVVDRNEALIDLEVEEMGKINAAALQKWRDSGAPGWGLEEKIQVIDEVVGGVWNLGEAGGKHARLVRKFERWLGKCQDVLEARVQGDGIEDEDPVFLEPLDAGWKDDCLVLGRKLETWRDQLRDLGTPDSGSSLAAVVDGCRRLLRGMLMELSVMAQVERDAMNMELEWIKSMNNDVSDDDQDTPTAGAIWRSQ